MTTQKTTEELERKIDNLKHELAYQKAIALFYESEARVREFLAKHSDMNNFRNYDLSVARYHAYMYTMVSIYQIYETNTLKKSLTI